MLRVGMLLFCLPLLVSCQPNTSRHVVTLWHQMRPADRAILDQRISDYEAQHPEVEVRALYKETEELRSGLESAVLVGEGPDIVYGPWDTLGVYNEIGAVQDMSPWFPEELQAEFDPRTLALLPDRQGEAEANSGARRDKTGGVGKKPSKTDAEALEGLPPKPPVANSTPFGFEPSGEHRKLVFVGDRFGNHLALVYNRDFVPQPPETTDELIELAKANTVDNDNDGRLDRYGIVWNYTEPFFVVPFLTGHGGWVFRDGAKGIGLDPQRPVPDLDTAEAAAAYQFVAHLKTKHQVLPTSADYNVAQDLFLSGKAAMLINGDWSWGKLLAAEKINAAIAPLPTVSSTGETMQSMVSPKGYSLTIAATGDRGDQAMQLVQFLTSEETQRVFLEEQKIIPSRLALRDHPLLTEDPTLATSLAIAESGPLMPNVVEMRAVWDAMRPPYQSLMAGNTTAAEATRQMQQLAERNLLALTDISPPDRTAAILPWVGVLMLLGLLVRQGPSLLAFCRDLPCNGFAYALALPSLLVIFLVVVFPLVFNIVLSFSNMSLQNFRDWEIVGLHNYREIFVGDEAVKFWGVFFKTIFWTAVNVGFHVSLGVLLAVAINGPVRGKAIYRLLLIIPWAVPAYITALTWRGMFAYEYGAVNQLVETVNGWLPGWLHLPVVDWLSLPGPAFAACIVANVWLGFPFMMIIALGGLQGIPQELYEAARIDRANRWQQFWTITLPMLMPVLLPAITLGAIWTFNNLNVVWLVSNGGEPADQTHILVSYVYKAVFNLYQYGYGAALSMVIFAMLLVFSMLFLNKTRATEGVA